MPPPLPCSPILHHVRLHSLKAGVTYFYIVGALRVCMLQSLICCEAGMPVA